MTTGDNIPVLAMPDRIRAHIEEICSSSAFKEGARVTKLFRYLVTEELEGRGKDLTPYGIAVDALGAPADFDPARSSMLRVEMHRLRSALEAHYSLRADSPFFIEFPLGSYTFAVRENHAVNNALAADETSASDGAAAGETPIQSANSAREGATPVDARIANDSASPFRAPMFVNAIVAFALTGLALLVFGVRQIKTGPAACPDDFPYISVSTEGIQANSGENTGMFVRELQKAITAYELFGALIEIDESCRAPNIYDMSIRLSDNKGAAEPSNAIWLTLVNRVSGEGIWTYSIPATAFGDVKLMTAHFSVIAEQLSRPYGAFVRDIKMRDWPDKQRQKEFFCFIDARDFLSLDNGRREKLKQCLEQASESGHHANLAFENLASIETQLYWLEDFNPERLQKSKLYMAKVDQSRPVGYLFLSNSLNEARIAKPVNEYALEDISAELHDRYAYNYDIQLDLMVVEGFARGNWNRVAEMLKTQSVIEKPGDRAKSFLIAAMDIIQKDWAGAHEVLEPLETSTIKLIFENVIAIEQGDLPKLREIWKIANDQFGMNFDDAVMLLDSRNYHRSIRNPLADGIWRAQAILARDSGEPSSEKADP